MRELCVGWLVAIARGPCHPRHLFVDHRVHVNRTPLEPHGEHMRQDTVAVVCSSDPGALAARFGFDALDGLVLDLVQGLRGNHARRNVPDYLPPLAEHLPLGVLCAG